MKDEADKYREMLIETVAETDDALLEKYLHGGKVEAEEIKAALRRATIAGHVQPVICGSAFKNKGVQQLLDAVVDYLPSPARRARRSRATTTWARSSSGRATDDAPFSALIFKIMTDPFVGQLAFFRVYSGHLDAGSGVFNSTKDERERIGRLLKMHANKREEIKEVWAGDIAAAVGLKNVPDRRHDLRRGQPGHPRGDELPGAGHRRRDRAQDQGRPGKDGHGARASSCRKTRPSRSTRTRRRARRSSAAWASCTSRSSRTAWSASSTSARTSASPRSPTARRSRRKPRGTGGSSASPAAAASTASAKIRIKPAEEGHDFVFDNEIKGGAIPKEFIKPIEQGIKEALETGILAGYPTTGVHVELYDGSYHDVDSSEMAFKIAGSMAYQDAAKKAQPIIKEPIMDVEVVVPEDYMGDVIGDLSSRRGHIKHMEPRAGVQVITARVPLSEMFGYSTNLRSMTQGRGNYTMQFAAYDEVPKTVSEEIIAKVGSK